MSNSTININDIRKDDQGEYVFRTYTANRTQTVNGRTYTTRNSKKYKCRLAREKATIKKRIMAKLARMEYLDLLDIAEQLENWNQQEEREYATD